MIHRRIKVRMRFLFCNVLSFWTDLNFFLTMAGNLDYKTMRVEFRSHPVVSFFGL